jgi:hypothetical protein
MRRKGLWIAAAILLAVFVAARLIQPSNDRDWSPDQALLAAAEIRPPFVTIRKVRNFDYRSETSYKPAFEDRTYDLRELDSVWFIVEPFGQPGAAHTFVSFGFADREYVAISVEIRKEKGESFSPLLGMLRRYEVMYVIGDERDLIRLRTNYRKDAVYLYRVQTSKEKIEAMFLSMLTRANHLRAHPEFYNTLTNTCTTNLLRHVNEIASERVPYSPAILLPSSSDRLVYDLGLIDQTFTFEETRRRAQINEKALAADRDPEFSQRIRE